jgi:hypothetical protein
MFVTLAVSDTVCPALFVSYYITPVSIPPLPCCYLLYLNNIFKANVCAFTAAPIHEILFDISVSLWMEFSLTLLFINPLTTVSTVQHHITLSFSFMTCRILVNCALYAASKHVFTHNLISWRRVHLGKLPVPQIAKKILRIFQQRNNKALGSKSQILLSY